MSKPPEFYADAIERDRRESDKVLCHLLSLRRALFDMRRAKEGPINFDFGPADDLGWRVAKRYVPGVGTIEFTINADADYMGAVQFDPSDEFWAALQEAARRSA